MPEMSSSNKSRGIRKSLPKTKTGCLTCRKRRVKCGEEKPRCLKCVKFGISTNVCEYPSTSLPRDQEILVKPRQILPRNASDHKVKELSRKFHNPIASGFFNDLLPFPSHGLFKTQTEYRCHHFFSEDIAHELAGFNPSDLWQNIVLQAAESNTFIRHAVIAIGALYNIIHKAPRMRSSDAHRLFKSEHDFAVQEYQKSLVSMRSAISDSSMDVRTALIACLLTVCFENAYGRKDLALLNCLSGTKLRRKSSISLLGNRSLPRGKSGGTRAACFVEDDLVAVLCRLDLSSMLFVDYPPSEVHTTLKDDMDNLIDNMPAKFNDMEEAAAYYNIITNRCWHFMTVIQEMNRPIGQRPGERGEDFRERWVWVDLRYGSNPWTATDEEVPPKWMSAAQCCMVPLGKWIARFDLMWETQNNIWCREELPHAKLLKLQAISTYISVKGSLYTRETEWDAHISEFREIVSLSEAYLAKKPKRFYFSFDSETLMNLYYVLWKCRDGGIRRQVLKLLDEHPRREGSWDAGHTASVGRWLLTLEEGSQGNSKCRDIKEDDRIRLLGMDIDTEEGYIRTWGYRLRKGERMCFSHQWPE